MVTSSPIPAGYQLIAGNSAAIAAAIARAVVTVGGDHSTVLNSPTQGGFLVPQAVYDAYAAPATNSTGASGNVFFRPVAPTDPTNEPVYFDTSSAPPVLKGWTGSAWTVLSASGGTLTNTVVPAVTGTATVGSTLTAGNGTWSASPDSYVYQWKRGGVPITGATASTYVLVSADSGQTVSVRVTAIKALYTSASATSVGTAIS